MTTFIICIGQLISFISKLFNIGNGSTWPGHIALILKSNFIRDILQNSKTKIILIAGTNGKTTTSRMVTQILLAANKTVFQNTSGANLLNGIASSLIEHSNFGGKIKSEYAIFEVDEFNLPLIIDQITPDAVIALNLFRDQLDRYGELDTIAKKWQEAFSKLPETTTLILNADDPLIAYLGITHHKTSWTGLQNRSGNRILYFGLNEKTANKTLQHAADSIYCPNCHHKLTYDQIYYSHLGHWHCEKCGLKRPDPDISSFTYPLPGTYNKYNTLTAVLYAKDAGIKQTVIENALKQLTPAFGRQETLSYKNKKVQIFLSKNPTSFNESLRTISDLGAKTVLLVLNDRIPDGRDISWIWDVDFENYVNKFDKIFVSGDRVYDLALRLQYSQKSKLKTYKNLEEAIEQAVESINPTETLYILPTYSAMLEVRKILVGRKIL